jgi:uncharacterized metal-binding protein
MLVVLPLFGTRVSPRCLVARQAVLAVIEEGQVRSQDTLDLNVSDETDLVDRLLELHAGLLVCGGISREVLEALVANDIQVVNNVAGEVDEVLDVLCAGRLIPGYGLSTGPGLPATGEAPSTRGAPLAVLDCLACLDRACLESGACPREIAGLEPPGLDARERKLFEVGQDVSATPDPALCRIAELVRYVGEMGYRRVGLAFCRELFREIELLVPTLSRFFSVVPVCCRVGRTVEEGDSEGRIPCNPTLQAALLERAGTELNVTAGLCMGCDVVFGERSHAPVTTLFVRDRTLAHNPMAAVYAGHHLKDIGPPAHRG